MTNANLHNYDRREGDFYPTLEAHRVISVLDQFWPISGLVLEPAAGDGALVAELDALDDVTRVLASDIHPAGPGIAGCDLFDLQADSEIDHVITNLPFRGMDMMILHLLDLYPHAAHAYLVRAGYLFPKVRGEVIHSNPRFAGVIGFTKRLKWFEHGTGSPAVDYVWLCYGPKNAAPSRAFIKFEGAE